MSLNELGGNRVVYESPPGTLDHIRPRTSFIAPWRISAMKTVELSPSVTSANGTAPNGATSR